MANRSLSNKNHRLCDCTILSACDRPVENGLSLTPAQIKKLTDKGIAVSQSNYIGNFDGSPDRGNFDIDPIYTRGMDQNTLWENAQVSKRKILSARDRLSVARRAEKVKESKTT